MFTLLLRPCCATILSLGLFVGQSIAQSESERIYPNNKWSHYESSEAAGFITKRLAKVEKFYNKQEFAGLLIVKDGAIAVDWGENERRGST